MCSICDASFTESGNLDVHIITTVQKHHFAKSQEHPQRSLLEGRHSGRKLFRSCKIASDTIYKLSLYVAMRIGYRAERGKFLQPVFFSKRGK